MICDASSSMSGAKPCFILFILSNSDPVGALTWEHQTRGQIYHRELEAHKDSAHHGNRDERHSANVPYSLDPQTLANDFFVVHNMSAKDVQIRSCGNGIVRCDADPFHGFGRHPLGKDHIRPT